MVTMATGAALAVPLSSTLLTACQKVEAVKDSDYQLQYLNEKEFASLIEMLDIILPKTDSPSAVEVGVHQIMDTMLSQVYTNDQKNEFSEKFTALTNYTSSGMDTDNFKVLLSSEEESDQEAKTGLVGLKQLAVAYYLSTEEVAKNHLNYLPIPGTYEPCISLESVGGKAWAL